MQFELTARNIANLEEFNHEIAFQFSVEDEKIVNWINSNYRRWLINHGPATTLTELPDNAPKWLKAAFAAKQEVHVILYDIALRTLNPIVDYFRHIVAKGESIERISVPQAIQKQKEWHEELKKTGGVSDIDEDHVEEVLKHPDGYYWLKLLGEKSLAREGDLMGHCVGGYYRNVASGRTSIYSLRDPNNDPHLTLEVKGTKLCQAKCKGNDPVPRKYTEKLLEVVSHLGITSFDDACSEYDLEYIDRNQIIEGYKKNNKFVEAPTRIITRGDLVATIVDNALAVPCFEQDPKITLEDTAKDLNIAEFEVYSWFDVTLADYVTKDDLTVDLKWILSEIWRKNCRSSNYRGPTILKLRITLQENNHIDQDDVDRLRKDVLAIASGEVATKALKYENNRYQLLLVRSVIDSVILQKSLNFKMLKSRGQDIEPNAFIVDKKLRTVQLAASISYKNVYILQGNIKAGFRDLIDKVSQGKNFISQVAKDVIKYTDSTEFDPNFTYLTVSPEIRAILHRGIFPSKKFNVMMQDLFHASSLQDFKEKLFDHRLLGVLKWTRITTKSVFVNKYQGNDKYLTRVSQIRRSNYYYYAKKSDATIYVTKAHQNIKAFFAALFCSPKTRKFLMQMIASESKEGKAMAHILKLCANPTKLSNALLYGYDVSHRRKNLIAAAKLLRNLDKFFDREDIKDAKILEIFDMIEAKRNEQQPKDQSEADPT